MSWDARGQIAKTQVYSSWKGRPYVRRYAVPANPNTPAQQETRSGFAFLNKLWPFMPAGAVGAWEAYAVNNRFTSRNGWLKQNVSSLRGETDLANLVISPAANGGIVPQDVTITPGAGQVTVAITPPQLPPTWTVVAAHAAAILDEDPAIATQFQVVAASDLVAPYSLVLSGLTSAADYLVGGWLEYDRGDGRRAYSVSTQQVVTPT